MQMWRWDVSCIVFGLSAGRSVRCWTGSVQQRDVREQCGRVHVSVKDCRNGGHLCGWKLMECLFGVWHLCEQ